MSTTIDNTMLGQYVSFSVYPASILGSNFTNVKLLAILDAGTAMAFADVASMHANVYPLIPVANRPANDYTSYSYLKVLFASGQVGIIGIPWIVNGAAGVSVITNSTITVVINGVGAADINTIQQLLVANNYNNITLSLS